MVIKTNQAEIDYADAFKALQRLKAQNPKPAARVSRLLTWLLVGGLTILLMLLLENRSRSAPPNSGDLAPWVIPLIVCLGSAFASAILAVLLLRIAPGLLFTKQRPGAIEITD